jgi:molybdopterin adenylyltransferase
MNPLRIAILTVSDRSYQGIREDLSGPKLEKYCTQKSWSVVARKIVPDEFTKIRTSFKKWCDGQNPPDIIFSTGGTGFAPRDVTPEATRSIIEKETSGLVELIRFKSMESSKYAVLSRGAAGIRKRTLIINLSGSPKAALEQIDIISDLLSHAVELLREDPVSEKHQ